MTRRVLLTTIFRPFSVPNRFNLPGDERFLDYFSNRLTRESGPFVLHDNHPTLAPHLVGANLQSADVTVLETPTVEEFTTELRRGYDVVGISFLTLHLPKLVHMVALARKHAPGTKVVIGGFGTALHRLEEIGADAICQGEGVQFMRKLLGEPADAPVDHPLVTVDVRLRLAVQYPELGSHTCGLICCGFGCPHRCEFCTTSAYYAGRHVPFVATGAHLYELMTAYDSALGVRDFIIYEEDFFLELARRRPRRCSRSLPYRKAPGSRRPG